METSTGVSRYFGSSHHPEKDLWTSLLSSFTFSTLLKFLVHNAAKLQGILSWFTCTYFLAGKKTVKMELSYMSMKRVKSYTFGFQKLILYTLCTQLFA